MDQTRFGGEAAAEGAGVGLTPMQRLQLKKQRQAEENARKHRELAARNFSQNQERVQRIRTARLSEVVLYVCLT